MTLEIIGNLTNFIENVLNFLLEHSNMKEKFSSLGGSQTQWLSHSG